MTGKPALRLDELDPLPVPDALEDGTDDGNARRFARLNRGEVLRAPELGRWFVWDGRRFLQDTRDATRVRARMKQAITALYEEAAAAPDEETRVELAKRAHASRSMARIRGAIWVAESDSQLSVELAALDADPWLLNVRNGTLDLRSGELREHRREDLLTRLATVDFDPQAECRRWLSFLERTQPTAEVRSFLQRAAGSGLVGLAADVPFLVHVGGGANGKSVFLETLRGVLGSDYSAELAAHALTARSQGTDALERALLPIVGKRLVTVLELGEGQRLHEQAVKRLVSGEPVRVRPLYAESFETIPCGTAMLTSNHALSVAGDDDGIWRRLIEVPWLEQIPEAERDPGLRAKLLAEEAPGILRWALEGCIAWQTQGLAPPESIAQATQARRTEQDDVGAFLTECCRQGPRERVSNARLRPVYEWWCAREGIAPLGHTALATRLKRRGFARTHSGRRGWEGFDVRPECEQEARKR